MTFLPLFGHIEATLGESSFEGSNELQIQNFKVFWKVDLKKFPMSYHGLNLYAGKVSKRDLKVALRFSQFLLRVAIFPVFYYNHGFSLMVDNLPM